jgi:predicted transcriptional regulator
MKAIVIGIMPQDKIRERVLSITRGEHKPKSGKPKIWFTSMRSLAEVLSDETRALLQVIKETNPQSIGAIAISPDRNSPAGSSVSTGMCCCRP